MSGPLFGTSFFHHSWLRNTGPPLYYHITTLRLQNYDPEREITTLEGGIATLRLQKYDPGICMSVRDYDPARWDYDP